MNNNHHTTLLWEVFIWGLWGVVLVVCVSGVSGVLFSVAVCVCDLLIFLYHPSPSDAGTRCAQSGARPNRALSTRS